MSYDPTIPEPEGRCRTCGRQLAPKQNYCREHKCLQTKVYGKITLICKKEVEHTGRCLFMFLGEVIETGFRK
jgi:hypothetical protein